MSNVRVEGATVIPSTLPPMVANMTLRDWYAGLAMQAEMISGIAEREFALTAQRAYKMADAMMEARKK